MREPYADRFRLILNDLGAGFAARGDDLAAIIQRADPALRQTDLVLAELASQNQQLANARRATATRSWLRWRARAPGHRRVHQQRQIAAEATAERSADLEAGFQQLPRGAPRSCA